MWEKYKASKQKCVAQLKLISTHLEKLATRDDVASIVASIEERFRKELQIRDEKIASLEETITSIVANHAETVRSLEDRFVQIT